MRRISPVAALLALALTACGDGESPISDQSGTADTDAASADASPDAEVGEDVADAGDAGDTGALTDVGVDATDGGDVADAVDAVDAADAVDVTDVTPPPACACDLTVVCEEGCSCDIACSAEVGPLPLGPESVGMERNEVLVFDATSANGTGGRVSLYDDRFEADSSLLNRVDSPLGGGFNDVSLAADVDDDGREEAIVVTGSGVHVMDWDGTALAGRSVYTYAAPDWFDAAVGDLDHDGGRTVVVTRQTGSVVTVEVLAIGASGDAPVRASVEVPGVARHAVAVGPPTAGEQPLVHLLVTLPPAAFREPAELVSFRLEGATLSEERRVALESSLCSVGSDGRFSDDGIALLVGDMDNRPGSEIFAAAYCSVSGPEPNLAAFAWRYDGGFIGAESRGYPFVGNDVVGVARVRPLLAAGRFSAPLAEEAISRPLRPVLGWHGPGPTANYSIYDLEHSFTRDLSGGTRQVRVNGLLTGLAVRDVDRDGVDDIVASVAEAENPCGLISPCTYTGGAVVMLLSPSGPSRDRVIHDSTGWDFVDDGLVGPILAVGDFDADSIRVRSTGNAYRHISAPRINSVVAAPPTWLREGVTQDSSSATTFGITESGSTSHGGILTYGGSVSIGIGVSLYKLLELYGAVTASFGVTHSWTFENSVTVGRAITAGAAADLVSYSRVIYVSHEYEVVSHPDPEVLGELMRVDVPGPVVEATTSLVRFRADYPEDAERMIPPSLFTHTVGQPDTYGVPRSCTHETLQGRMGTGVVSAVYESPSLTDVGDAPSGSRSVSVDVETQTEQGVDAVFEVGGVIGGALVVGGSITAYVGGGYSYRTTIGSGASYTGTVGVITEGYGPDTRFQWGLCLFHWADDADEPQHASYPVVTYVVDQY